MYLKDSFAVQLYFTVRVNEYTFVIFNPKLMDIVTRRQSKLEHLVTLILFTINS